MLAVQSHIVQDANNSSKLSREEETGESRYPLQVSVVYSVSLLSSPAKFTF